MTTRPFDESQSRLLAGRYLLHEQLGRGGMGVVWRAHDELLDREVAVKELQVSAIPETELHTLYTRMQQEARAAARIDHPSVVTVHDVVEQDGRPWIVMELVDGESLAEIITQEGTLLPREAARVGAQVASALVQAHRQGVLHRDVKPANVMIDRRGRAVLTDFGIARFEGAAGLTRTGEIVGSPDYLSPERVTGHRPGPESDLWALGATLYAAVEGQSPFLRNTTVGTLNAVMSDPLPDPVHAGPLAPVIEALMDKDPTQRVTGDEVVRMLEEVARGRTPPTPTVLSVPAEPQDGSHRPAPPAPPTLPLQPPAGGTPPSSHPPGGAGYRYGYGSEAGHGSVDWPAGPGPGGSPFPTAQPTPPAPPGPSEPPPPQERRRRRGRGAVVAAAALAALLVGGGAAAVVLATQSHTGNTAAQTTGAGTHSSPPAKPTSAPPSTPASTPTTTAPSTTSAAQPAPPAPPPANATPGPAQVVTSYYDAINAHDYTTAWNLGGKNLGGSFSSFSNGFADTASDTLTVDSVSGDQAFVHLHAVHNDGSTSDYSGSYTVQDGVITGASIRQIA